MAGLALYIHVPFCRHKCIYCDFYSSTHTALLPRYLESLQQEIAYYRRHPAFAGKTLTSIYWGGGTPSLIPPEEIHTLLEQIRSGWALSPAAEITLEANPGALDSAHLAGYRQAGINRLSMGIQSFNDSELALLTRIHSAAEALSALASARAAGFANISLDLIFGLPGQSNSDYEASLRQAIACRPAHLSLYGLTIETGTPLAQAVGSGRLQPCDEEVEREMFLTGKKMAEKAGYQHYEISNYALPGCEARHNQHYWEGEAYLGLGPAAHSFAAGERFWNGRDLEGYLAAWRRNEPAVAGRERIGREEEKSEALLLGLRRRAGIDLARWRERFGEELLDRGGRAIARLGGCCQGLPPFSAAPGEELLTLNSGHLALTQAGVLLYDMVCQELCAALCA